MEWVDVDTEVVRERYILREYKEVDTHPEYNGTTPSHFFAFCQKCHDYVADWRDGDEFPSAVGYRCHTCGYNPRIRIPLRVYTDTALHQ